MRHYPFLNKQEYNQNGYSILPIRDEDKYIIMHMRNDQAYHLRQQGFLTKEQQDIYFATVIADLFKQNQPNQILFSFLKDNECIGYGGLVHINWEDKNAEISFIIKPELEEMWFNECWYHFLSMLQQVAFDDIKLHKIYTYAFDVRPHLYPAIEAAGFVKEAVLKEHHHRDGKYNDVVIHAKWNAKY